ncbi:hypothetical protein B296_00018768 [Ensete ventricosum]|uniref:Uncharacterized protein n=1 Tax=Ensete ventricosum TaxID=4639 RepID=A0A426Z2H9_ENSVE|nr:hypothetical protein B296_00018768 [Ensete ventricosum]
MECYASLGVLLPFLYPKVPTANSMPRLKLFDHIGCGISRRKTRISFRLSGKERSPRASRRSTTPSATGIAVTWRNAALGGGLLESSSNVHRTLHPATIRHAIARRRPRAATPFPCLLVISALYRKLSAIKGHAIEIRRWGSGEENLLGL